MLILPSRAILLRMKITLSRFSLKCKATSSGSTLFLSFRNSRSSLSISPSQSLKNPLSSEVDYSWDPLRGKGFPAALSRTARGGYYRFSSSLMRFINWGMMLSPGAASSAETEMNSMMPTSTCLPSPLKEKMLFLLRSSSV